MPLRASRVSRKSFGAAHRLAGVAVGQEVDDAPVAGLGDHHQVADHQDGVRAQFAAHRFHQVDAAILDADFHILAAPSDCGSSGACWKVSTSCCALSTGASAYCVPPLLGPARRLRAARRRRCSEVRARRFGELAAQPAADAGPQAALPAVYALQQGALARRTRRTPAELVRVLQLLEELHGIVDAVDAELQRRHVPGAQRHRGFAARAERARRNSARSRARLRAVSEPVAASSQQQEHTQKLQWSSSECSNGRRRESGDCPGADASRRRESAGVRRAWAGGFRRGRPRRGRCGKPGSLPRCAERAFPEWPAAPTARISR